MKIISELDITEIKDVLTKSISEQNIAEPLSKDGSKAVNHCDKDSKYGSVELGFAIISSLCFLVGLGSLILSSIYEVFIKHENCITQHNTFIFICSMICASIFAVLTLYLIPILNRKSNRKTFMEKVEQIKSFEDVVNFLDLYTIIIMPKKSSTYSVFDLCILKEKISQFLLLESSSYEVEQDDKNVSLKVRKVAQNGDVSYEIFTFRTRENVNCTEMELVYPLWDDAYVRITS